MSGWIAQKLLVTGTGAQPGVELALAKAIDVAPLRRQGAQPPGRRPQDHHGALDGMDTQTVSVRQQDAPFGRRFAVGWRTLIMRIGTMACGNRGHRHQQQSVQAGA